MMDAKDAAQIALMNKSLMWAAAAGVYVRPEEYPHHALLKQVAGVNVRTGWRAWLFARLFPAELDTLRCALRHLQREADVWRWEETARRLRCVECESIAEEQRANACQKS